MRAAIPLVLVVLTIAASLAEGQITLDNFYASLRAGTKTASSIDAAVGMHESLADGTASATQNTTVDYQPGRLSVTSSAVVNATPSGNADTGALVRLTFTVAEEMSLTINGSISEAGADTYAEIRLNHFGIGTLIVVYAGPDNQKSIGTTIMLEPGMYEIEATVGGELSSSDTRSSRSSWNFEFTLGKPAPVVFLHGIAGSDLKVGSRKIWPSAFGSDVEDLALSPSSPSAVAVDVVRDFALKDYYGSFLSRMVSERGYVEYDLEEDRSRLTSDHMLSISGAKPSLFTFPYDWRADNATHTATLHQYIQKIRQLHNNSKVNLIAHSMGGLVVRRYMLDYGTEDIDKVITVGSPFLGAVKPIYLLHSGDFYDNALDTVNSGKMKAALATMPGLHQLLPAPTFLANSPPVFAEAGIDLDRDFFTVGDYTDSQLVSTLKTLVAPTPSPMETNRTFHNFNGGKQDNWSGDVAGAVKFLHFVGIQQVDSTIVKVNATPYLTGLFAGTLPLLQRTRFVPVNGEGDGTVPILSSRRLPTLLAPGTIIREIREPLAGVPSDEQPAGQAAEHTLLMSNLEVWAGIDEFLATGELPSASPAPATFAEIPSALAAEAEATQGHRKIGIIGAGYIKIRDLAGNTNAMVGETAATRVPGVEARYGGSEPWVDLSFVADKHIILEGDPSTEPLDILVTEFDGTGTAKSMHRYRVIPDGHAWQMVLAPGTVPGLRLDLDDNADFSTGETVPPTFIREGAAVDTTAPTVTLTITRSGENIVVNLGGSDGTQPAPAVRYSMDGNAVLNYSSPLVFPRGEPHVLKAFAEDGVGNTSGLIETTLNPALSVGSDLVGTITLEWPASDGYVLEEAGSLEGPWPISTVTVVQSGLVNRVSIPIGDDPKKFFRLRAIPVAR